jgi:predicted alpha/beta-fold hydrolase
MAFSWFPGACSTTFTHSENPLILQTKKGPKRALPELVKDVTPPCNLNPFLFNGHLQTAWTSIKYEGPKIHYKRRVFESEDAAYKGHFAVDFVSSAPPSIGKSAKDSGPEDQGLREDPVGVGHHSLPPRTTYFTDKEFKALPSNDTKPLLITLHGLSGGSYETYLRHVLEPLVEETPEGEKAGGISGGEWEALVVNARGCAGSKVTTSILFNARATWDIRQVVKWARKIWPNRPLFGIGFSLGANILTNVRSFCERLHTISIMDVLTETIVLSV